MSDAFASNAIRPKAGEKALVAYFSGTGGVARVSKAFCDALSAKGVLNDACAIDAKGRARSLELLNGASLLFLVYPVYAFDAAPPVYEWLSLLPGGAGRGKTAAVVSVSGGGEMWPNTSCRVYPIRELEAKGFDVAYESMMAMPSNCLFNGGDACNMHLLKAYPAHSARIVEETLSGVRQRVRRSRAFSALVHLLSRKARKGFANFGRSLALSGACSSCGLCARECPMENISMREGRPVFAGRCVSCLRCLYGCPAKALSPIGWSAAFKDGFSIDEIERRMEGVASLKPVDEACKGLKGIGIRRYLKRL